MIRYGKNVLGVYGERVAGFKRSYSALVIRDKSGTSLVAEVYDVVFYLHETNRIIAHALGQVLARSAHVYRLPQSALRALRTAVGSGASYLLWHD